MESVLNIEVSRFSSFNDVNPTSVNLLSWLTDNSCLSQQERVKAIEDKGQRDIEKGKLPCITPSGLFSKRGADNLIKHSYLIQVDIDSKGNEKVFNYSHLKDELCKIPNVAYCGLSVSGRGYWLLIPIAYPEKHKEHFEFIRRYFEAKGLTIDKACSDVSRLRVYAYDPGAYFNHSAKPLQAFYEPQKHKLKEYKQTQYRCIDTPVYEQYNVSDDYEQVLFKHGWQLDRKHGIEVYYTRPGKSKGISAGFNTEKRTFYVFTDGSCFDPNTGYSAFAVYAILEHAGDYKKATLALVGREVKQPRPVTGIEFKRTEAQKTVFNIDDAAYRRIVELAKELLLPERMYMDVEIVQKIQTIKNATRQQAEQGFYLMAEVGAIEETLDPTLFYLRGSTPF